MTPSEFKAWFDGFTEAFSGVPTKAQWARIKARVAEIDGKPVTERVFIDRYWPPYRPWRDWHYTSWGATANPTMTLAQGVTSQGRRYSATSAMYALGKSDAQSLAS
jgi:uncharacterized protein YeaO (DUF488 family)